MLGHLLLSGCHFSRLSSFGSLDISRSIDITMIRLVCTISLCTIETFASAHLPPPTFSPESDSEPARSENELRACLLAGRLHITVNLLNIYFVQLSD
jgi:hypothetical protein